MPVHGKVAPAAGRYLGMSVLMTTATNEPAPFSDHLGAAFRAAWTARDAPALEAVIARLLPDALAQARRRLGHAADADDAVQQACLTLLRTAGRYDGRVPLRAWFARLVHGAVQHDQRARMRRRRHEAAVPAPAAPDPHDPELLAQVRAAVAAEAQKLLYEAENVLSEGARASLFRRKLLDKVEGIVAASVSVSSAPSNTVFPSFS